MNSGVKLVRWIMVVTLGCSLGLLFIFIVVSMRPYQQPIATTPIVRRTPVAEAPFKISEETIEKEIRQVVEGQLSAFREDDYPKAFTYAASSLRAQLSLPAFERMVKTGYPVIAQSTAAEFGVILDNGDHAVVNVTVLGDGGRGRHYQYILSHERAGWKIGGVTEVRPTGTTI